MGWYGPVGRNVCTARKGVRVCGVKNALQTAEDGKKLEEKGAGGGFGENTHELEKNAKILEKKNTIIVTMGATATTIAELDGHRVSSPNHRQPP